jgi:hypothetical protein
MDFLNNMYLAGPIRGEILEGMYAQGRMTIEDSRIRGKSGRAGGLSTVSGTSLDPAGIVSRDSRVVPT